MRNVVLLLAALAPAACATDPKPTHERGWIGGRFADVTRGYGPEITDARHDAVVGMPASAPGDGGALVTAAFPDTPLARAGLAAGDLVLSVDGAPAESGVDLRERVEAMAPGSRTTLSYWRDGAVRTADVVVGRETYESAGLVRIGLWLSPSLDLWPFDDGINLFGLVRAQKDGSRQELHEPTAAYRRQVDADAQARTQEMFEVFVVPIGVGKGKRVLRQETLP